MSFFNKIKTKIPAFETQEFYFETAINGLKTFLF